MFFIYMDAQDIQDLVLGVRGLVTPGIRKPAPDHLSTQLLVQELLVLCILCILFIHVHKKIDPRRRTVGANIDRQIRDVPVHGLL